MAGSQIPDFSKSVGLFAVTAQKCVFTGSVKYRQGVFMVLGMRNAVRIFAACLFEIIYSRRHVQAKLVQYFVILNDVERALRRDSRQFFELFSIELHNVRQSYDALTASIRF